MNNIRLPNLGTFQKLENRMKNATKYFQRILMHLK